tara:strand:- start:14 stop:478 length:465 start_codon:yes stop_codon:yes gene_type:complete
MSNYRESMTMNDGTRKDLTPDEAEAIWKDIERIEEDRKRRIPTSEDAMRVIMDANKRLNDLGWRKGLGIIGVKRGDKCAVREKGSTGIWSGRVDEDGKYVMYCDGVSEPRKVWLKPLDDLTDDERVQMAECDKNEREWHDRMIQSLIASEEQCG